MHFGDEEQIDADRKEFKVVWLKPAGAERDMQAEFTQAVDFTKQTPLHEGIVIGKFSLGIRCRVSDLTITTKKVLGEHAIVGADYYDVTCIPRRLAKEKVTNVLKT